MQVLDELSLYSTDFLKLYQFFARSDLTRKLNGFFQAEQAKANQVSQVNQS